MKNFLRAGGLFILGVAGTLLLLEAVLRMLPVNYPTAQTEGFGVGRAAMHVPGSKFTYSRDWDLHLARTGRIGPQGFHGMCETTRTREQGVFITGDSYTEAIMLAPEQSVGAQLHALRPDLRVCAAGISGAGAAEFLAQYDELSRLGAAKTWVLLLNRFDFMEGFSVRDGMAAFPPEDQPSDKELVGRSYRRPALLEKSFVSALARYLYYNLDAQGIVSRWTCSVHLTRCNDTVGLSLTASPIETLAMERLFAGVVRRAKAADQTVLVYINDVIGGKPKPWESSDEFWTVVEKKAASLGIATMRTSTIMKDGACGPHGCYLFRDGHWSAEGHRALAVQIARALGSAGDSVSPQSSVQGAGAGVGAGEVKRP